ncbi:uncharacterized protein RCC_04530 [Ramularia collo-cygni]|uniref:DASH complex subunit DAM1 n=1 Tax=Ramularia collo-cygni TaxID=112498 RepID=A0A2D3V569_9PEZI|nr:uncharacterized protein RCC_04530 [Ramularia collo-cygni]CZT18686.1 uncharacterized protein RCC_04530 [Ramularia collo-cygni]
MSPHFAKKTNASSSLNFNLNLVLDFDFNNHKNSTSPLNEMATTVVTPLPESNSAHKRSTSSRSNTLPSRPTTPLRSASRTSLRASQTTPTTSIDTSSDFPLTALEPAFGELSDAMADLEANFMHLQLLNESLGRFNENFAAFLYGMNMSAFCVDFSEAPVPQSFAANHGGSGGYDQMSESPFLQHQQQQQMDATFLTSDTSFVNDPPPTSVKKSAGKYSSVPGSAAKSVGGVGRGTAGRGRAGSGIARGTSTRGRGTDRGRAGSGIGRGIPRGRSTK